MNRRPSARPIALVLGAAVALTPLLGASAAHAQPLRAEDAASCEVTGGTLSWGVKESFRSYISGTIANGEWEARDGASYETPDFTWSDATGSIDPETGEGSVSFVGTVHFTGHDGVLDLTLANPTVEFDSDGSAALLLDAKSTDVEGKLAVDAKQEWVGDVTLDGLTIVSDTLDLADLPVTLTNGGTKAFAGFYEAGADLDPLSLSVEFAGGCEASVNSATDTGASSDDEESEASVATDTAQQAQASIPWLPIGIGGVALFVIGLTVGLLIGGRGKSQAAGAGATSAGEAPAGDRATGLHGFDTPEGGHPTN